MAHDDESSAEFLAAWSVEEHQQYVDQGTIDYHLHLVEEKLDQLQYIDADLVSLAICEIQSHIQILFRRYVQDGRVLLSRPCKDAGTPEQYERLQRATEKIRALRLSRPLYGKIVGEQFVWDKRLSN